MPEYFKNEISLPQAILSTVAFFDIFDHPLTSFEIWRFLYRSHADYLGVLRDLELLLERNILQRSGGFYFLPGREEIVFERAKRFLYAQSKYKIAMRWAKFFSHLPFVRLVAVCNSLSLSSARLSSDIDFFVVGRTKRLWTTRLVCVALAEILGMRVSEEKFSDKICLSFFASDSFREWKKISRFDEDIYLIYWIANLQALYDAGGAFQKFWENCSSLHGELYNIFPKIPSHLRRVDGESHLKKICEWIFSGSFGDIFEKFAKRIQLKKMPQKLQDMSKMGDTRVVISDEILKFHSNDRREIFQQKWLERISSYPLDKLGD